jgi:hypothetical protein
MLQKTGDRIREVYFPGRCLSSTFITMRDGCTADIAVVGPEGLLGIEAVFGLSRATSDVTVRIAGVGWSYALDVDTLQGA